MKQIAEDRTSLAGNVFEAGVDFGACGIFALGSVNSSWKKIFEYVDALGKWSMLDSRRSFLHLFAEKDHGKESMHHVKIFMEGLLSGISYATRLTDHLAAFSKNTSGPGFMKGRLRLSVDFLHMNIGNPSARNREVVQLVDPRKTCVENLAAESGIWFDGENLESLVEKYVASGRASAARREWWWLKGEWWQSDLLAVVSLYENNARKRTTLVVGDMNHRFVPFVSSSDAILKAEKIYGVLSGKFEGDKGLSVEGMLREMGIVNGLKFSESVWDNVFIERMFDEDGGKDIVRKTSEDKHFYGEIAGLLGAVKAMDTPTMKILQAASYAGSFIDFAETCAPFSKVLSEGRFNVDEVFCSSISQWGSKTAVVYPSLPADAEFLRSSRKIYALSSTKGGGRRDVANYVVKKLAPLMPPEGEKKVSSYAKILEEVLGETCSVSPFGDDAGAVLDMMKKNMERIGSVFSVRAQENKESLLIRETFSGRCVDKDSGAGVVLGDDEYFITDQELRELHGEKMLEELDNENTDILFLIGHPGIGKTHSLKKSIKRVVLEEKKGFNLLSLVPRKILGEGMFEWITPESWGVPADTNLNIVSVNSFSDLITASTDPRSNVRGCARYATMERLPELEQNALESVRSADGKSLKPVKLIYSKDAILEKGDGNGRESAFQHTNKNFHSKDPHFDHVMDCLMGATERVRLHFSNREKKPNGIIACATLQAVVNKGRSKDGKMKNSMDSILPRFFGVGESGPKGSLVYSYKEAERISADYPVMILFIDEITGTEEGAATLRSVCRFLKKHKTKLKEAGMTVKVVVADASLVGVKSVLDFMENPAFESRILHIKEKTRLDAFSYPVSVVRKEIGGKTSSPLRCSIVDCNAFPAARLDMTYHIPTPVIDMDFSDPWSAEDGRKDRIIKARKRLSETIISIVRRFIADSKSFEQILVFVQDKSHLDIMGGEIRAECGLSNDEVLVLHSKTDKSGLGQEKINSYRVVLMTSTANRGVSFNNATRILFQAPSFSPEEQLAEIIQFVFRGRGRDAGGLIDDFERDMKMDIVLSEKTIRIPFHAYVENCFSDEEGKNPRKTFESSVDAAYCSSVFELLEQIVLIRLSVLTRIAGRVRERTSEKDATPACRLPWERKETVETSVSHLLVPVAKQFMGDGHKSFKPRQLMDDLRRNVSDMKYVMSREVANEFAVCTERICSIMNSASTTMTEHNNEGIKRAEERIKRMCSQLLSHAPKSLAEMLCMSVDRKTGAPLGRNKTCWDIGDVAAFSRTMIHFSCGMAFFECGKTRILYKVDRADAEEGIKIAGRLLENKEIFGISQGKGAKAISAKVAIQNLRTVKAFFRAVLYRNEGVAKQFEEDVDVVVAFPVSGLFLSDGDIERYRVVMNIEAGRGTYENNRIVRSMTYLSGEGGAGFSFDRPAVNPLNDGFRHDSVPFLIFCPDNVDVVKYKEFANKGYSASGLLNIMQLFSGILVKWNGE